MTGTLRELLDRSYSTVVNIGADPEIFVEDTTSGQVVPAFTFLEGKTQVPPLEPYWDGFQAEFETQFGGVLVMLGSIRTSLVRLSTKAKALNVNTKLSTKSVITVKQEYLDSLQPQHKEFGCTPSLNAYGDNPKIPDGNYALQRTAGGHLHFSFGKQKMSAKDYEDIVKMLDATIGVLSVLLFRGTEEKQRREFYGRAGEYRLPPHGLEYRVLSNAWLCDNDTASTVCKLAVALIKIALTANNRAFTWLTNEEEVREAINNNDVAIAEKILNTNMQMLAELLYHSEGTNIRRTLSKISTGITSESIEQGWHIPRLPDTPTVALG